MQGRGNNIHPRVGAGTKAWAEQRTSAPMSGFLGHCFVCVPDVFESAISTRFLREIPRKEEVAL
jgi:hypothetical protein